MTWRWLVVLVPALVAALAGCGADRSSGWVGEHGAGASDVDDAPVAAFRAHFSDPSYDDLADELAPFGSDEGADLLAEWAERRDELDATSTVADVLRESPSQHLALGSLDDAIAVRSAGFVLLRLTGHIDDAGRRATLAALDALMDPDAFGPEPVLRRQRDDLRSWRE